MATAKNERQLKDLRSKLAKALEQVQRIRSGKMKRRTLTEALNAAMSKST